MRKIICFLTLIVFLLDSCKHCDSYYTKKGGFDYIRIPLLKPYDIKKVNKDWTIQFTGLAKSYPDMYTSSVCVKRINVIDSIIIASCYNSWAIKGKVVDHLWCFIIPNRKVEASFDNESEFLDSLSYYTKKKPDFIDIEEIWLQYKDNGYLTWFPTECK
jgi:hypothetical protein